MSVGVQVTPRDSFSLLVQQSKGTRVFHWSLASNVDFIKHKMLRMQNSVEKMLLQTLCDCCRLKVHQQLRANLSKMPKMDKHFWCWLLASDNHGQSRMLSLTVGVFECLHMRAAPSITPVSWRRRGLKLCCSLRTPWPLCHHYKWHTSFAEIYLAGREKWVTKRQGCSIPIGNWVAKRIISRSHKHTLLSQ